MWLHNKAASVVVRRCQKQLNDLVGAIVKLCNGNVGRNRRVEENVPVSGVNASRIAHSLLHEYKIALLTIIDAEPQILFVYLFSFFKFTL